MDDEKYSRSIAMVCPTCGSKDFEYEGEDGPFKCNSCERQFTREELVAENGSIIDANVEEVKAEVLKDVEKEITDMLRKSFSGSKSIKFR